MRKAGQVLASYAKATGAKVCVVDQNNLPIPEFLDELADNENTCLHCLRYRIENARINSVADCRSFPCGEMHVNAFKEAHHFGGSYIYMCDLGFLFWTSPIYENGRFAGSLISTGFLGIDSEETTEAMYLMGQGKVPEEELKKHLELYPRGESERIKGMAEILLICAENISTGNEDYHETLKRRAAQQSDLLERIQRLKIRYPPGTPAPGYPLDKERTLLAALRRGDNGMGREILNELLAILLFSNPDHFKFIQFRAIELVVLLSRVTAGPGTTGEILFEINNHYLRRIQETKNSEELTDELHTIIEHMAEQIFSFRGIRHGAAIRKAEWYIWENYTRKISLQEIAGVSGLSAPYFSTIFKEEMGENLSGYLNRLRVEKASGLLTNTSLSLSEIAGACGFEDQSWFSKIFKSYTGMSPGKYRTSGGGIPEISENNLSSNYRRIIKKKHAP
ncbi:MAG: helix-turn-helix domain-containing protein [Spirochaetaceae bacterium]|nr:helix-turn-helix domain-containing protein [Spirochaetaceae bacterium]